MRMRKTKTGEWHFRGCFVIVSKDDGLWHLSISRKNRLPSYYELKEARYCFMPDVQYAAQIFPPVDEFINVHQFCLHLWELSGGVTYSDDIRKVRRRGDLIGGKDDETRLPF